MELKRFKQLTWLFTFLFLAYGFQPFKFPQFSFDEKTELLIETRECTCCPDFYIVKGELKIPKKFKKTFSNKIYDFSVEKNHELDNLPFSLFLGDNEYIVTGEIIGIGNNDRYCPKIPIVKITKWRPTKYKPYFFSFEVKWIIRYFYTGIGLIVFSLILIFIRSKKNKEIKHAKS